MEVMSEPGLESWGSYMKTRGHFKERLKISFALDFISFLSLRHIPNNFEETPRNVLRKGR